MDRLTEESLIRRHHLYPKEIWMDLSNMCHFDCIMCGAYSFLREGRPPKEWQRVHLSYDLFSKLLSDPVFQSTEVVTFLGDGEPFMNPRAMDMIRETSQVVKKLRIITNGAIWTPEKVRSLVDWRVWNLIVSMHAGTAQGYTRIHPNQTAKTFYLIKDRLRLLEQLKVACGTPRQPWVVLQICVNKESYQEIESIVDFAAGVGANGVMYNVTEVPSGMPGVVTKKFKKLLLTEADLEGARHFFEKAYKKAEDLGIWTNIPDWFPQLSPRIQEGDYTSFFYEKTPCYIGWILCMIDADGGVYPCCGSSFKKIGYLTQRSLEEIWFSEEYFQFREEIRKKEIFSKYGCNTCGHIKLNEEAHHQLAHLPGSIQSLFMKVQPDFCSESMPERSC